MPSSQPLLHCPNPRCTNPLNALGEQVCAHCQSPLTYRYLWAIGAVADIAPREPVTDRYYALTPQVWLETQPATPPEVSPELPAAITTYLQLYPYRLHVPEVYGACLRPTEKQTEPSEAWIYLLDNIPVDRLGRLYPAIAEAWPRTPAVRQVYWLWQMLQLWQPLSELGVAGSLLKPGNVRVEGWRVRLLELDFTAQPTLQDLGHSWLSAIQGAQVTIAERLQTIIEQMRQPQAEYKAIASQLNQLLLEQAAQLPLRLQVLGSSDSGPQRSHNEDACYPTAADLALEPGEPPLLPYLSLVCDGIGGHEGGEVASQMAVRSLQLQMQALLMEVAEQTEPVEPDLLMEQIEASLRVVNNLIAVQNDTQGRESRQRMGTTLVMALQLPQRVRTPLEAEFRNTHELYLAHVGDSRAYWITPAYCHCLTVDDDVITREVRLGRSLACEAVNRPDAGALTQALGTKDAEFLRPTVQRFILEEDGILLLCSDGLSDNGWVEQSWSLYAEAVLKGRMTLEAAVQSLIDLANQKNGHDNTSVVLTWCRISLDKALERIDSKRTPALTANQSLESEFSEASKALLSDTESTSETVPPTQRKGLKPVLISLGLVILLSAAGGAGLFAWSQLNPAGWQRLRERLPEPIQQLLP